MSARLRGWLLPALFAAMVVVVYADPLFGPRTFVGRDIVPYNLPLEHAVHDAWSRGRIPVWWESVSGGRPLGSNPNAGVFYPLRPALAILPLPLAVRIFPVFHWILGGLGMLGLLRAIGGSRGAAWVAAGAFAFSGVLVSEVFYSNFQPGANLLPWTLWALVRPARGPAGRLVPLALVYGAMLLAGDAFSIATAVFASALWILLETPAGERRPRTLALGAGLAAALLLALPQVLATALLAPETRRIVGGLTLAEVTGFTLPVARLAELLVPYPFGAIWSMDLSRDWGTQVFRHFFATIFVAPIAFVGLFGRAGTTPRGARFARALFFAALALALSGHLLPAAWGRLPSPVPLRYLEKFMVGGSFALAVAAGLAVDRLRAGSARARGLLVVSAVLTLAAGGSALAAGAAGRFVVAAAGGDARLAASASRELAPALAVAGLLWAATAIGADLVRRTSRAALGAGLLVLTAVPVAANRPIAQTAHEATVFPPTAFARTLARRDPDGAFRTVDESLYQPLSPLADAEAIGDLGGSEFFRQGWFYFTPTLWKRGTVLNSDLDAGDLSRIESLRKISSVAAAQPDSAGFFSTLSLRYGIRFRDQKAVRGISSLRRRSPFDTWDENPDALPDLRLSPRWREVPGPVEALGALPRLPPEEIVVETGRHAEGRARPGSLRILEKSPERLVARDGEPRPVLALRPAGRLELPLGRDRRPPGRDASRRSSPSPACPVPAGRHRIEWREGYPGLALSRWGPLAGLPAARRPSAGAVGGVSASPPGAPGRASLALRASLRGARPRPLRATRSSRGRTSRGATWSPTTCRWRRASTTPGRAGSSRSGRRRSRAAGRSRRTRTSGRSTRSACCWRLCRFPFRRGSSRSFTGSRRASGCWCSRPRSAGPPPRPGSRR